MAQDTGRQMKEECRSGREGKRSVEDPQAAVQFGLPGWILGWFYATAIICTYDASYIVLRPHSMPGGCLETIWAPYKPYLAVDGRYNDVNDPFVYGISLFNYLEVALNVIAVIMHYRCSRHTVPTAFMVTVMTFWKTLFYFYAFTEMGGGGRYRNGNSVVQEFFLVVIPNGVWVVLPLMVIITLWPRMLPPRAINNNDDVQVKKFLRNSPGSTHAKKA